MSYSASIKCAELQKLQYMDSARDYSNVLYQRCTDLGGSVLGKISFGSDWYCTHQFEHPAFGKISIPLFEQDPAANSHQQCRRMISQNPSNRQRHL
uniref:Uncharacterized protein n=1 Tax=Setaria viridis TaxID=4556 RepID=A0A4U6SV53_SETVI|nr:hypothetical protein SEVIR_9G132300v2 [Setaria viridis]